MIAYVNSAPCLGGTMWFVTQLLASWSHWAQGQVSTRRLWFQLPLSCYLHGWASCRGLRTGRRTLPCLLLFCEPSADWFLHESLVERFTIFTGYKNAPNLKLKGLLRKSSVLLMLPTLVFGTVHLCVSICMALQGQPLYNKLFWGLTPRSSEISVRMMVILAGCLKLPCFIRNTKPESEEELNGFSLSHSVDPMFCSQVTLEKSLWYSHGCALWALPGLCQAQAITQWLFCSIQVFGDANPDCCQRNWELLGKMLPTPVKAFLIEIPRCLQHSLCGYLRERQPRK